MDAATVESLSISKTLQRFDKLQDRAIKAEGDGATVAGKAITKRYLERLSVAVSDQIQSTLAERKSDYRDFVFVLQKLSADVVALSMLQTALHSIGAEESRRATLMALGSNIAGELWAAELLVSDTKFHKGVAKTATKLHKDIARSVTLRHSSVKYRKVAARSIAKQWGFKTRAWSKEEVLRAGAWLAGVLVDTLPDVFLWDGEGDEACLTLEADALEAAMKVVEDVVSRQPVYLPMVTPPVPWTDWNKGGFEDVRAFERTKLVRARSQDTQAEIREAIRSGQMQPTLDAVNNIQAVPYKINTPVLEVVQWCYDNDVAVKGLPRLTDVPFPPRLTDAQWEGMNEDQRRAHKYKLGMIKQRNRTLLSDRLSYKEDVETAKLMAEGGTFYTPWNLDWRGRTYPLPHFNFQRDDRVRALFLFADGEQMTEEGLWWLKVYVANCGDFDKISKRPMEERVQWVDQNIHLIQSCATDAVCLTSLEWWTGADKPFLFMAACMELTAAIQSKSTFVTHLPISFDGSCSGLQHLAAMTRAEEGSLVNLTNQLMPQDVYNTVSERVAQRLLSDTSPIALAALAFGVNRKLVKRNVMTYSYSSKKFGMSEQLMEDVMRPLGFDVIEGKLPVHPFKTEYDYKTDEKTGEVRKLSDGTAAARYLASHIYDAIEEIVEKPAQAMGFLQKLAKALAHEGKPLKWVTPTGLPWTNRYHVTLMKRVQLWLSDVRIRLHVAVGDQKEIDKDKAANGVAPNFVHACDAAHLMLTVNASVKEGIKQIATVHDSFGCLAPHAKRFNEIIREQFVQMYEEHDVLSEVFEQAKCDLTQHNSHRLPEEVAYGSLDIKGVLNARYAFA